MTLHADAIHDQGVLRLLGPTPLLPHQHVRVAIEVAEPAPAAPDRAARMAHLRATIPFRIGPKLTRVEMNAR